MTGWHEWLDDVLRRHRQKEEGTMAKQLYRVTVERSQEIAFYVEAESHAIAERAALEAAKETESWIELDEEELSAVGTTTVTPEKAAKLLAGEWGPHEADAYVENTEGLPTVREYLERRAFEYARGCACEPVEVLASPPEPPHRLLLAEGLQRVVLHVEGREPPYVRCASCGEPWEIVGAELAGERRQEAPIMENDPGRPADIGRKEKEQHEKGEQDLTNAGGAKPVGGKTTNAPPHTSENPGGVGPSDVKKE